MSRKIIAVALLFLCQALSVMAQNRPENLGDVDRITGALADRLEPKLRSLPRGEGTFRLAIGRFTLGGEDSPLGDLVRSNLVNALANIEPRPWALIDAPTGVSPAAEYLFSGEILDVVSAVRLSVRLVKAADSSIIAAWTSDFDKTPWISGLLETVQAAASGGARRDSFETDSQENPVPAEIGGAWVSRTIHDQEDRDWFLIVSPSGGMLTAETSGSMDTMMELFNDAGSRLQSNDDGGEGTNSRITFQAEAGRRYVAMVRGYGTHTGSYRFHVITETVPDEALEPNNSREEATPLALGGEGLRAFLSGNDEDWFRAEVPPGGARVTVYTESGIDTFLTIFDGNGTRIAEDDDSGESNNARVTVNLPGGAFYIKVSLYSSTASQGSYTLFTRVQEPAAQDAYEPDNQISQAKDISPGQSQTRNFTDAADVDWVRLRITRAGRYRIRARGEASLDLDTYVELLDASEEIIGEDDDGGQALDSLLVADLQPGSYYIKVSTLDRDPAGNYVLSVEME